MVRYMGQVDVARVSVPFGKDAGRILAYAHFKPSGFIDELVLKKWRKLGLATAASTPMRSSSPHSDRRDWDAPDARRDPRVPRRNVARQASTWSIVCWSRNEYASYWAIQWGDLLRNKRRYGDGYWKLRNLRLRRLDSRRLLLKNVPYDQFVQEFLTAQGDVSDTPPVVWYREVRNVTHQVNDTSQLFLGTRIQCANCHHHPYEKWSQDDYWGFAAHFARLGQKQGAVANENAIFVRKDGGMNQPRTGRQMKPKPLGAPETEFVRGEDPRQKLVDWMTAENPYFAKSIANRMWSAPWASDLVEAVDDMRVTNPPSNPALLDALAKDFVAHKFRRPASGPARSLDLSGRISFPPPPRPTTRRIKAELRLRFHETAFGRGAFRRDGHRHR